MTIRAASPNTDRRIEELSPLYPPPFIHEFPAPARRLRSGTRFAGLSADPAGSSDRPSRERSAGPSVAGLRSASRPRSSPKKNRGGHPARSAAQTSRAGRSLAAGGLRIGGLVRTDTDTGASRPALWRCQRAGHASCRERPRIRPPSSSVGGERACATRAQRRHGGPTQASRGGGSRAQPAGRSECAGPTSAAELGDGDD